MRWLFHAAGLRQHQDPSFTEFAAAALGFLCFSVGAALTAIGEHIFDQVEISERWARRPYSPSGNGRRRSTPAFLVIPDNELIATLSKIPADQAPAWHIRAPWQAGGGNARI